jgi:hypothetical protein
MPLTFISRELSPRDKAQLFIIELTKYSDNKDDPVSDWEFNGIVTELDDDDEFNCICSTRIKYLHRIHRKNNNMMYIDIGSECIKRWMNPSIECDDCSCVLKNVMKRMKAKDFLCNDCKKERVEKQKREWEEEQRVKKEQEKEEQRLIRQQEYEDYKSRQRIEFLGNLYYFDDYITYRKLKDIVDDEDLVLSILQRTRNHDVIEYFTHFYSIS